MFAIDIWQPESIMKSKDESLASENVAPVVVPVFLRFLRQKLGNRELVKKVPRETPE